jgi:hypothetical protein
MSCVHRSCNPIEIFASTSARTLNRILIWKIHVLSVYRSCTRIGIFPSTAAKYLNTVLVWIIHLLCVHPLCDEIQVFASTSTNDRREFLSKPFIFHAFIDHLMKSKSCLPLQQNISTESCYDLFISHVFNHRGMNSQSSHRHHQIFEQNSTLPYSCLKRLPII